MIDKVQKIREEVARIQLYTQSEVLKQVLDYIDVVQKEPISEKKCMFTKDSYADEDRKVLCEDCKEKCEYSKKEEPVSKDLEEAAFDYAESCKYEGGEKLLCIEHFKAGAYWKEQQFEKNRLAHCDAQTEEEAEIEQSFVMGIIEREHRQPTFDDAIKYGMQLQKEQMMAIAIDASVTDIRTYKEENEVDFTVMYEKGIIPYEIEQEVKLIIIKED